MTYALVGTFWFAVGYAASVWTWTKVHAFVIGAQAKANALRTQASLIEAKLRGG